MQGTMSVTMCLTLLAMVLAIALGGHAVSADPTSSSKAKQLVSLGSMPSSPSSVADEDSKMHSLRTRDTTSAETAEERDGLLTLLKKAYSVVEEALLGTRAYDYLPLRSKSTNSLHSTLLDVKSEHAHGVSHPSPGGTIAATTPGVNVDRLPLSQGEIWFKEGWMPREVVDELKDVSSGPAKTIFDDFMKRFNPRDSLIRGHFQEWHDNNLDSIASEVSKNFHIAGDASLFYEDQYLLWRVKRLIDGKDRSSRDTLANEHIDLIIRGQYNKWRRRNLTTIDQFLIPFGLSHEELAFFEEEYKRIGSRELDVLKGITQSDKSAVEKSILIGRLFKEPAAKKN